VDAYGIRVGDEVELVATGAAISIVPARAVRAPLSPEERLRYFDEATRRQRARRQPQTRDSDQDRGWTRDELYTRGRPR
jgi:hypothetical protein